MKKLRSLLAVCILAPGLYACSASAPEVTAPGRARLNGSGLGSGNFVDPPAGTAGISSLAESDSTTTARNGSGLGSGN